MKKLPALTLLVSSTGSLLNGLLALITTLPQIGTVLVAEEVELALKMIMNHQPALVILDMNLPQTQDLIKLIQGGWPQISLLVLVEDRAQQIIVEAFGVDHVLRKGFSAQEFITSVENLIRSREGDPPA
jgi:DNA-binding NarL/FixJ family response regulator